MIIKGDMSDYGRICHTIIANGSPANPRGVATHELLNFTLVSKNPRNRIVRDPERKINRKFAAAEFVSLMTGRAEVGFFTRYISSYGKFSSDGEYIDPNIAYGRRLHTDWENLLELLRGEEDTREAVVPIFRDEDYKWNRHYVTTPPCTCMFQFFARNGFLHMTTTMRSNDAYFGLPYDYFCFTMLMEWVAASLGLELGVYTHNVGSMHVYDYDIPKMLKLSKFKENASMEPMSPVPSLSELSQLGDLLAAGNNDWINNNLL